MPNDIFCAIACVTTWTSEGNSHGEGIKMAVPFGQSSVERITPRACVHEFLWPNPPNRFGCAINTCGAIVVTGVPMYASAYLRLSLSLSLSLFLPLIPILCRALSSSSSLHPFLVRQISFSLFLIFPFASLFPSHSEKEKENEMRTGTSGRNREERAYSRSEEDKEKRSTKRMARKFR